MFSLFINSETKKTVSVLLRKFSEHKQSKITHLSEFVVTQKSETTE